MVFNARTGSQIARKEPVRLDPPASDVPGVLISDENVTSTLFPDFRIRPARFFTVGRVFLVLWSEPGGGHSTIPEWEPGIVLNSFHERVYSNVRRFVVIRQAEGSNFCQALPINTYDNQRVAKAGVNKSEHCIFILPESRRVRGRTNYHAEGASMACINSPSVLTQTLRRNYLAKCHA